MSNKLYSVLNFLDKAASVLSVVVKASKQVISICNG